MRDGGGGGGGSGGSGGGNGLFSRLTQRKEKMQQFVAMQLHGVHSSVCSSKCATKPFYFRRLLPAKCSSSSSLTQDFLPRSQATFYDFSHRKQTGTVWSCKRKPFFGALSSFFHLTLSSSSSSSSSSSFQSSQLFSSKKRVGVGGGCEIIAASGKDRDKKKKKKNTSSSGKKQGEGGGSRKAAATPKGNVWSKDFTDRTSSSNARDSQSDTRQKITSGFKNSRDTKEAKSSRLENETRRGGLRLLETEESDREVNGDRKVSRGNQLYNQAEIAIPEEDYGILLVSGTIPAEIETVLQTAVLHLHLPISSIPLRLQFLRTSFHEDPVITEAFHYVFSTICAHSHLTGLLVKH